MSFASEVLPIFDRYVRQTPSVLAAAYRTTQDAGTNRVVGPFPTEGHTWIDCTNCDADSANDVIDRQIAA